MSRNPVDYILPVFVIGLVAIIVMPIVAVVKLVEWLA